MKQNTANAVFACMSIAALLTMPLAVQTDAQENYTYHPGMVAYLQTMTSQTGTQTITQSDGAHSVVTTNTVTRSGDTYAVHSTTTVDGETVNNENVSVTQNRDGTYRLVNTDRSIDVTFTDDDSYLQGRENDSWTRATITLQDREYAEEGELIALTDDYRGCWGNYATFTAGVDTTDDTYMTWNAKSYYITYCLVYLPFDYIEISHGGNTITSEDRRSNADMSNPNGEGWYSAYVKAYYRW